jgi:hypothetical protein
VNLAAVWLQHMQQAAELSEAGLHLMRNVGNLTTGWGNDFFGTAAKQATIHATIIAAFEQHYACHTTQHCSL